MLQGPRGELDSSCGHGGACCRAQEWGSGKDRGSLVRGLTVHHSCLLNQKESFHRKEEGPSSRKKWFSNLTIKSFFFFNLANSVKLAGEKIKTFHELIGRQHGKLITVGREQLSCSVCRVWAAWEKVWSLPRVWGGGSSPAGSLAACTTPDAVDALHRGVGLQQPPSARCHVSEAPWPWPRAAGAPRLVPEGYTDPSPPARPRPLRSGHRGGRCQPGKFISTSGHPVARGRERPGAGGQEDDLRSAPAEPSKEREQVQARPAGHVSSWAPSQAAAECRPEPAQGC